MAGARADAPGRPRSTGCGTALQQWVEEMAPFLKAIDPNHLVTIGEEGFYSTTCERCAPMSGPRYSRRGGGRGRARGAAPARAAPRQPERPWRAGAVGQCALLQLGEMGVSGSALMPHRSLLSHAKEASASQGRQGGERVAGANGRGVVQPHALACILGRRGWVRALLTLARRGGRVFLNPGAGKRRTGIASSPWASQEGQDFLANHVVPSIDLVTTHIWADNWMGCAP